MLPAVQRTPRRTHGSDAFAGHPAARHRAVRPQLVLTALLLFLIMGGWRFSPQERGFFEDMVATAEAAQNEPPFTRAELTRWIELWPDFSRWAERHGLNTTEMIGLGARYRRTAALDDWLQTRGIVPARFFTIFGRATLGLMQLEMQDTAAAIQPQTDEQKRLLRENPEIPEDQKRLMLRDPGRPPRRNRSNDGVHPSELRLVRAYRDRLMTIIGGGG